MDEKMSLLEKCKKNGGLPGFAISKMPIPVFEAFMSDIEENYNGIYWTKLQDLMRKAEGYDTFVQLGMLPGKEEPQEEKDEGKVVKTFTGEEKVN